jgi:electron transfer flavoprotein alpha subunit
MATLLVATHADGVVDDVSLQAIAYARAAGPVSAVLIGPAASIAAGGLAAHGVATSYVVETPELDAFAPDAWAATIVALAGRSGAARIVGPGTEQGNDVLARVAARLGQPFAANAVSERGDVVTRVRWGGSLLEEARLHGSPLILSVAPHTTAASEAPVAGTIEPFAPTLEPADLVVRVRERLGAAAGGVSLADAKVVVTGGRGVGSADGFGVIEELAALLGGAVGCSRAVTMAGWRSHTDQVGQTGTKIAPEIYIPCGVSGATQHIAGCKGAKRILAINKDPEAPIMSVADYAVIGDLHEVVPAIAAEIRRVRG